MVAILPPTLVSGIIEPLQLSGQQLLAAAGYPSDSSTDQLEQFFLDIRQALATKKSIVKLERSDDGQDWFALAEPGETKKAER